MPTYLPVYTSPQGETETLQAYQAVMECWPIPYTELTIPTRFGETHVIANGPPDAPPVVFLHALFATAAAWYANVGPLSRHYRTYAVDILGEANKSRPIRPIQSLDEFAQWFSDLIDGLGIDQLGLVGNSYGGFTAAYYAMHLPERVRKLVLVGPAATIHGMPSFYWNMFIPKMMCMFFPRLPGAPRRMQHSVDWMRAGLPPNPAWERLFYFTLLHGSMTNQVMPRVYKHDELAQIQAPTLLVLGEQEKIYNPHAAARAALRLIPGLQVELIPNAHHITALAQPDAFNRRLLQFLGS